MKNGLLQNEYRLRHNVALSNTVQHEFDVKYSYDWILNVSYTGFLYF